VFLGHARKSRIIGKVSTLKDLDNAEPKMNKARLALLDKIDRPQRDNQKYRQMVSQLSDCIEQYSTSFANSKRPRYSLLPLRRRTINNGGATLTGVMRTVGIDLAVGPLTR